MSQIVMGMIGLGTVGTGVIKLLAGRGDLRLKTIALKNPGKKRRQPLPAGCNLTPDAWTLVNDPEIEVVVEVMGGNEPALSFLCAAINQQKHVVTANKELLAAHGPQLFDLARKAGVTISFEAAVAGGVPIVSTLSRGISAHLVSCVYGILNGTSNFILSAMEESGECYKAALGRAQKLGLTEADPVQDVEGMDTANKLSIISALISGQFVKTDSIYREGITNISEEDILWATQLGYRIKLIGSVRKVGEESISVRAHPCMIPLSHPLATISGYDNGIVICFANCGDIMLAGPGAGQTATAGAVVGDLINLAQALQLQDGVEYLQTKFSNSWAKCIAPKQWSSPFFLRLLVKDQPDSASEVGNILEKQKIGIASMHEKADVGIRAPAESHTPAATVVVTTTEVQRADIDNALTELTLCPLVLKVDSCISILSDTSLKLDTYHASTID